MALDKALEEPPDIGRIILGAVASLPRRVTRTSLAQLLAGAPDSYLRQYAEPYHGVLARHSLNSLRRQLDALIERGLLEAHLEDDYRRVFITPAGIAALRDSAMILPNPRVRSAANDTGHPVSVQSLPKVVDRSHDADEGDRSEQLRSWRLTEARRTGTAPFTIFQDSVLRAIARANPASIEELGAIPGVGPRKVEQYGKSVLLLLHGDTVSGG